MSAHKLFTNFVVYSCVASLCQFHNYLYLKCFLTSRHVNDLYSKFLSSVIQLHLN